MSIVKIEITPFCSYGEIEVISKHRHNTWQAFTLLASGDGYLNGITKRNESIRQVILNNVYFGEVALWA